MLREKEALLDEHSGEREAAHFPGVKDTLARDPVKAARIVCLTLPLTPFGGVGFLPLVA